MAIASTKNDKIPQKLYTKEWGNDDYCIVFLHGLGGTSNYWLAGAKSIEYYFYNYPIMVVDLLGFGDSPKPWLKYNLDAHKTAFESVTPKDKKLILVGHSLGALLALNFAKSHPQQVLGIIALSLPFFPSKNSAFEWLRLRPSGWIYTNMFFTALACLFTRRVVGKALPYFINSLPRKVVEDLVKHTVISSTSTIWSCIYDQDENKLLTKFPKNIPVELIHCKDDSTAPFKTVLPLASKFSHWRLHQLSQGGHHPWYSQHHACINIIHSTISRLTEQLT